MKKLFVCSMLLAALCCMQSAKPTDADVVGTPKAPRASKFVLPYSTPFVLRALAGAGAVGGVVVGLRKINVKINAIKAEINEVQNKIKALALDTSAEAAPELKRLQKLLYSLKSKKAGLMVGRAALAVLVGVPGAMVFMGNAYCGARVALQGSYLNDSKYWFERKKQPLWKQALSLKPFERPESAIPSFDKDMAIGIAYSEIDNTPDNKLGGATRDDIKTIARSLVMKELLASHKK